VFNVVWTGSAFPTLVPFVRSLMAHSTSRFRFVANACPPDQVALMQRFRDDHPDRVIEVLPVSEDLIAHGQALDIVRAQRDDGAWFSLVDPDIKANGPWVDDLTAFLCDHRVVTSGKEVWTDDNLVPEENFGVAGEHFFGRDGFVYGSPHLAIYQRGALEETTARWGIGLGSAGPELSDHAKERLRQMGIEYLVFDTAKLVNTFMQADGHALVHHDLPQLIHIGGLSHYIAPSSYRTTETGEQAPEWTRWDNMATRHDVTRFTAHCLLAELDGNPAPAVPGGLDPVMETKLSLVRAEVIELVACHGAS
jgi:hypothetical protein